MADRTALMLRLTHSLARLPAQQPLPARLCQAYVEIVAADSGAIAVGLTTSNRTLLCATNTRAARFEDAQDLSREGPSLDAFATGLIVASATETDLRRRWPHLTGLAAGLPHSIVHAVPMRPGDETIGVLTVHHVGTAPDSTPGELQFLTDAVGAAILGDLPGHLDHGRLWADRDLASQATGMVIAQLGLGPQDALAVLRAHAYAHDTSLLEVSRLVVRRELRFAGDDGPQ